MAELGRATLILETDASRFNKGMSQASSSMKSFGKRSTEFGKSMSLRVTAPILAFGAAAIAAASQLDTLTDEMAAGTGATGDALESLSRSAREVFAATGQSAEVVGAAMADLNTQFGLTGTELEGLGTQLVHAARIMKVDAAQAATSLGQAMDQFGVDSSEAGRHLDHLMKLSQDTGVNFGGLLDQIRQYSPAFNTANFTMEETADVFAQLAGAGLNVSEIMPGIKSSMLKMADAGVPVKETFIAVTQAIKNAATEQEAIALAFEHFGVEGSTRLHVAIRKLGIDFSSLGENIDASTGTVNKAVEETRTLSQAWDEFRNTLIKEFAPVAVKVADSLKAMLMNIKPAVVSIGEFVANNPRVVELGFAIAAVAAVVGPLSIAIGGLVKVFAGIKTALVFILPALKVLLGALVGLTAPAWAIVAVVAAMAAGIWYFWEAITENLKAMKDWVAGLDVVKGAAKMWESFFGKAEEATSELTDEIVENVKEQKKQGQSMEEITRIIDNLAKKTEGSTKEQKKQVEVFKFQSDAMSDLREKHKKLFPEQYENKEMIRLTNELTTKRLSLDKELIASYEKMTKAMGSNTGAGLDNAEALDSVLEVLRQLEIDEVRESLEKFTVEVKKQPGVWEEWSESVDGIIDAMVLNLATLDFKGIKANLITLRDSFLATFTSTYLTGEDGLIKVGLKNLMKELDKLIGKLTGKGSVKEALLDAFGGGKPKVPSTGTPPGVPSGGTPGGTPGGGLAGALGGGWMGAVTMVSSVVSAVSDIISNFQLARQENTLNAIEENTRRTLRYIGDREDGGIVSILFGIRDKMLSEILGNAELQFSALKVLESHSWLQLDYLREGNRNTSYLSELNNLGSTMTSAVKNGNKALVAALTTKSTGPVFTAVADPNAVRA